MSGEELLQEPSGRAVAVFDCQEDGELAYKELFAAGIDADHIGIYHGQADAAKVDDSPKWFADTDEDVRVYKRKLELGHTVVSVLVDNTATLEKVQSIFTSTGAKMMTHFGQFVTVSSKLN